jgi:hypothetical protein
MTLKPGDQSRGWRRRWEEAERELEALLAPSTEPLSGDSIHAARRRLHSFYVQTYHIKDALIAEEASTGVSRQLIEKAITDDPDLSLLADLANLDKHGKLTKPPRSGHVPIIRSVEGDVPDSTSEGWRLRLTVDHGGSSLDGLEMARKAMDAWRRTFASWGLV